MHILLWKIAILLWFFFKKSLIFCPQPMPLWDIRLTNSSFYTIRNQISWTHKGKLDSCSPLSDWFPIQSTIELSNHVSWWAPAAFWQHALAAPINKHFPFTKLQKGHNKLQSISFLQHAYLTFPLLQDLSYFPVYLCWACFQIKHWPADIEEGMGMCLLYHICFWSYAEWWNFPFKITGIFLLLFNECRE